MPSILFRQLLSRYWKFPQFEYLIGFIRNWTRFETAIGIQQLILITCKYEVPLPEIRLKGRQKIVAVTHSGGDCDDPLNISFEHFFHDHRYLFNWLEFHHSTHEDNLTKRDPFFKRQSCAIAGQRKLPAQQETRYCVANPEDIPITHRRSLPRQNRGDLVGYACGRERTTWRKPLQPANGHPNSIRSSSPSRP